MTDQPALGPKGQLLDATKIEWYNNPNDTQPIQPIQPTPSCTFIQSMTLLTWGLLILFFVRSMLTSSLSNCRHCYAPLLIFGARATYLSHFVSSMTAYHLCVLPARLSALPDSFRTQPLSRYLVAIVLTRHTYLTFLFSVYFRTLAQPLFLDLPPLLLLRVAHFLSV